MWREREIINEIKHMDILFMDKVSDSWKMLIKFKFLCLKGDFKYERSDVIGISLIVLWK